MLSDMMTITNNYPMTKDSIRILNYAIQWLSNEDIITVPINTATARKYRGDFSGLLNELGVPVILHPVTMSLNNIYSSDSFLTDIENIRLISEQKIKGILNYTLG